VIDGLFVLALMLFQSVVSFACGYAAARFDMWLKTIEPRLRDWLTKQKGGGR
jgi:hypothetical protein